MAEATCSIEGCERRKVARGWCATHYGRWRRHGDPGANDIQPRRTGCQVEGCDRKHFGRGYCQTHRYRWAENGDPLVTRKHPGVYGESNPIWKGDEAGYSAVHYRLIRSRGSARDYDCVRCGDIACDWAYNHSAEHEKRDEASGLPYSTDLSDYLPLCRACHMKLDHNPDMWTKWAA